MRTLKRFVSDERGLETVEYAVMAALIVVGLVATVAALGSTVRDKFQALDGAIQGN